MFDDEKVIRENEHVKLATDYWSKEYTRQMREPDINGIEMRGWTVVKVIPKDGSPEYYVAFDGKGEPYRDFASLSEIEYFIVGMKMMMMEENDLIQMAERKKSKKKTKGRRR